MAAQKTCSQIIQSWRKEAWRSAYAFLPARGTKFSGMAGMLATYRKSCESDAEAFTKTLNLARMVPVPTEEMQQAMREIIAALESLAA